MITMVYELVRFIRSVPGYHMGPNIKKWGNMKLRSVLEECVFGKQFCNPPLVYQEPSGFINLSIC